MKNITVFVFCLCLFNGCVQQGEGSMSVLEINKGWTYQEVDGTHTGNATVPGTIHTDLLHNGQIEDPFYRTNEKDLQWIDKKDWIYKTTFDVDIETLRKDVSVLNFKGLDTYADVYLNGKLVLKANNMHRTWSVEVKDFLKEGKNQLKVYLHSPIKKGLELYDQSAYAYPANNDQSENGGLGEKKISVFTRKAGYHYGWDWGPRFVTSGIWRKVELRSWSRVNIESVFIRQPVVTSELAKLLVETNIKVLKETEAEVSISYENGDVIAANTKVVLKNGLNKVVIPFEILHPNLWWSNGLGDPNMYDFQVQVKVKEGAVSTQKVSVGLRSVKLVREPDKDGESFLFELNGVRVFAKGANYIPNDSFLPRVTPKDYDKVVDDAVQAHMNMLRVWGGGIYEDDYFYDLCDRNGIMVWQDFMFACSMYPGNDAMLQNIKQEAIDNVTRLRNHPSIVLWCGNNEINTAWHYYSAGGWGWKERYTKEQQQEMNHAYIDIFHGVLPEVVEDLTELDYWPSSPQAGYEPQNHASYESTSGDTHYWGVWHALHRFEDFDKYKSRFMSEYGFQSFPDFKSVQSYAIPADYDIESDVMTAHQRSGIGNLRIKSYLSWYYQVPDDFEEFLYLSQVLQAKGIGMAIEAHRRAMPYCMGSLYWQINDCWPVASWSSTDYYHNWKAAHYAVKKAFEPVLISAVNKSDSVAVYVVSDLQSDVEATLNIQCMDMDGHVLYEKNNNIVIQENTSALLLSLDTKEIKNFNKESCFFVFRLESHGEMITSRLHYLVHPKDLRLNVPQIELSIEEAQGETYLNVKSNTLVRNLYLYDDQSAFVLDDNYFDLLPGEVQRVRVLRHNNPLDVKGVNFRYIRR